MRRRIVRGFVILVALAGGASALPAAWAQPPRPRLPGPPTVNPPPGAPSFKLTVVKAGSGTGTVKSLAGGIDCGSKCSNVYPPGVPVQLKATPGTGIFDGWSGDCTGTGSCVFAMTKDRIVHARFEQPQLRVTREGPGAPTRVVSEPTGIDCPGTCRARFNANSTVRLSLTPAAGYLAGCGGDCGAIRMDKVQVNVTVNGTETVEVAAIAGTVVSSPPGINCAADQTCRFPFPVGTSLRLTARPAQGNSARWGREGCAPGLECAFTVAAAWQYIWVDMRP